MRTNKGSKREEQAKLRVTGRWARLIAELESFKKAKKCDTCGLLKKLIEVVGDNYKEWDEQTQAGLGRSLRSKLRKEIPGVVMALLKQAQDGNCPHAKLLFEVAGVENMTDEQEKRRGESLTKMLLSKLG
jgi:hypothetical protein